MEEFWRIQESGDVATVRMHKKELDHKGMKVIIEFHCQDTTENENDENVDDHGAEEDEEDNTSRFHFRVILNRSGKNYIFSVPLRMPA